MACERQFHWKFRIYLYVYRIEYTLKIWSLKIRNWLVRCSFMFGPIFGQKINKIKLGHWSIVTFYLFRKQNRLVFWKKNYQIPRSIFRVSLLSQVTWTLWWHSRNLIPVYLYLLSIYTYRYIRPFMFPRTFFSLLNMMK